MGRRIVLSLVLMLFLLRLAGDAISAQFPKKDIKQITIVMSDSASYVERIAAEELVQHLNFMGKQAQLIHDSKIDQEDGLLILIGTLKNNPYLSEAMSTERNILCEQLKNEEGFYLKTLRFRNRPAIAIAGGGPRGVLYSVGRFLRFLKKTEQGIEVPFLDLCEEPMMSLRGIFWSAYARGGDDYTIWCLKGEFNKLRRYFIELMLQGMNTICITYWPDDPGWFMKTDEESRKRQTIAAEVSQICKELTLKVIYWWPINTVPREWWEQKPQLHAVDIPGLWGYPGFCPSNQEGIEFILKAREAMLKVLPAFDILHLYPRDIGGCGCSLCKPFSKPYVQVALSTFEIARKFQPNVESMLNLWYFTAEEEENEVIPLFLKTPEITYVGTPVNFNLSTNHTDLGFIPYTALPSQACRQQLISDKRVVLWNDITMRGGWGRYGLYPIPRQIKYFYDAFPNAVGSLGYSEGVGDHLNKLILLNLAWNPNQSLREVLSASLADYLGPYVNQKLIEAVLAMELGEVDQATPLLADAERELPAELREGWHWQYLCMFVHNAPIRFEIHRLLRKAAEIAQQLIMNKDNENSQRSASELADHIAVRQQFWQMAVTQLAEDCHRLYPQVHQIEGKEYPYLYGGPPLLDPADSSKTLDASYQLGIPVIQEAKMQLREIASAKSYGEVLQTAKKILKSLDGYRYYDDCRSIKDGTMGVESITPEYGWVRREETARQASIFLKATALQEEITVDFEVPQLHSPIFSSSIITYATTDFSEKRTFQKGQISVNSEGKIIIPNLNITREGVRLRLNW